MDSPKTPTPGTSYIAMFGLGLLFMASGILAARGAITTIGMLLFVFGLGGLIAKGRGA